jgi:hypothetical protein
MDGRKSDDASGLSLRRGAVAMGEHGLSIILLRGRRATSTLFVNLKYAGSIYLVACPAFACKRHWLLRKVTAGLIMLTSK